MRCPKRLLICLFVFLFSVLFVSSVYADYSSISFSPSEGTIYGEETPIRININSGEGEEFYGIDLKVSFTGPVEYVRAQGVERCSTFDVTESEGTLNIICLSINHEEGEGFSGTLATLYFKANSEGTANLSFSELDPNIGSVVNGQYSLTTSTDLPETAILDNHRLILMIGFFLIMLGLSFNYITTKVEEERLHVRRAKLESKF